MFLVLLIPLLATSGVLGQFALSFGTTAPPAPKSFDPNCKDKMDTCWKMPESNCRAPYEDWAQEYCPNRCGYCMGPTTPAPPCVNKLPNCESYDKTVCTSPDYTTWAGENCRYFCRMCPPSELQRLDSITTTIKPEDCVDKVDCRSYGANACSKTFAAWSKDNCPNYCNYCQGIPTPPPTCQDNIPNCKAYNPDTCTNPEYTLWVEDNCKKFCGKCGGSGVPTPAPPMMGNAGKDSPTIPYAPPTPPSPGKRAQGERPKRQFQANHHHQGGSHDCWDGTSTDPYCNTAAPNVQETTPSSSIEGSAGFPGSEYHPHPKPNPNWDSKPSTDAPKTTMPSATQTSTVTVTVKPPLVTGHQTPTRMSSGPTTTTAPPTESTPSVTTTTEPSSPSTEASTTTTEVPSVSVSSAETTTSLSGNTSSATTPQATGPSTTGLAVKTPGSKGTSASGGTSATTQTPALNTSSSSSSGTLAPVQTPSGSPSQVSTSAGTPPQVTTSSGTPPPLTASTTAPLVTASTPVAPVVTASTAAPSTSSTIPAITPEPCVDTVDNCALYGKTACETEVYRPWAKAHCSRFCQFCKPVTLTPFVCKDKLANCKEFDSGDLCTADSYFAWSRENCFAYCGFPPCGNNTGGKATTTPASSPNSTPAVVAKSGSLNCSDKLDNCLDYPDAKCVGIYESWARSHCALRCGYCSNFLPCEDVNPDCDKFPTDSCTSDSFKGWARKNCRKYCNLCARPTENPTATQPTGTKVSVNGTMATPEIPHTSVDPIMMTTT